MQYFYFSFFKFKLYHPIFCSKTPRRLVGARATREGGVLLLKLISEIVTFLYSVRFSNHRISYELPSANYIHCSITDFPN